jgi:hypothetical protein
MIKYGSIMGKDLTAEDAEKLGAAFGRNQNDPTDF